MTDYVELGYYRCLSKMKEDLTCADILSACRWVRNGLRLKYKDVADLIFKHHGPVENKGYHFECIVVPLYHPLFESDIIGSKVGLKWRHKKCAS